MILTFLKKENNKRLILIFAGWSTGPDMYSGIDMPGWDTAVVWNYLDEGLDTGFFDEYCTVYLVAWSLGVAEADRVLPPDRITAAFAINGTVSPVNARLGIPAEIYHGTADNLSPLNLQKFRRRMMPDNERFKQFFPEHATEEACDMLAQELRAIAARNADHSKPRLAWTRAYIGSEDRIFPPANMNRAWQIDPEVVIVNTSDAHYIDLQAIVAGVIPDLDKVSRRFGRAWDTYESQAIPQLMAALHLDRLICDNVKGEIADMLEIGPGTGLLTRQYARHLNPRSIDFVDITETGPFDIASECRYHVMDAELWIRQCERRYDLIVSASAIQWFSDLRGFFSECARVLRPGGWLAISTFAPGNLEELDALRPSPLIYPSAANLGQWLGQDFEIICLEQNEIRMEFESRRQLLLHLKHTGVGGSASSSTGGSSVIPLTALTYRPLYIVARRKF
ncbi:MAG: DUF452 family protein [Bacteroidales bacterium]|nr:DUF452 family protein [Bacteroidales bacterium]